MTTTTALFALLASGVAVAVAPTLLARITARAHRPVLGVLAWQASAWTLVVAVTAAAIFILAPTAENWVGLGLSPGGCVQALLTGSPDHPAWLQVSAALGVAILAARLTWCCATLARHRHRRRARHRELLDMLASDEDGTRACVVASSVPMAYCIPGRGGRIVLTSAAADALPSGERAAVLAHEQAHLRGRHHVVLAGGEVLDRAFPGLPLFRLANVHTARLIEMRADEIAARACGRSVVAAALERLAELPAPGWTLAATGTNTASRIRRLRAPAYSTGRAIASDILIASGAVIVLASLMIFTVASHALLCVAH